MLRLRVAPGLELVQLGEDTVGELHALVEANRAHLARWFPWAEGESLDDTAAFVRDGLRRHRAGDGFELGIRDDGRLVGVTGFHHVHAVNRNASLG